MAVVVMAMAKRAEIIWFWLTKEKIGPVIKKRSSIARIRILKILLPNRFPIARSMAPIFNAPMQTTTSGREVEIAIKILPTKV